MSPFLGMLSLFSQLLNVSDLTTAFKLWANLNPSNLKVPVLGI